MTKIVDSCSFQTKSSEGRVFELEDGRILIGFLDPMHTPKIKTTHVKSNDSLNLDLLKGFHLISHDKDYVSVVTYE